MNQVTIPFSLFNQHLRQLMAQRSQMLECPVSINRRQDRTELIVLPASAQTGNTLLLSCSETFQAPAIFPSECVGALLIGMGQRRGQAKGVVNVHHKMGVPLHHLRLVGAGMHTIRLENQPPDRFLANSARHANKASLRRWSRTIGALGQDVWQRLVGLRYGIIGLGRSGSHLALSLAKIGVQRLTLVDPDRIEAHNLGEMQGVAHADIGRTKVKALAGSLESHALGPMAIVPVPQSVTRTGALHALQACDLLCICADHDSARLAAAAIATLYCKPLLDIAAGIHGRDRSRRLGFDIRLMLPGHCLFCFGGLRNQVEAQQVLFSARNETRFYRNRQWRQERVGSVSSLNQCATAMAMRMLEDFIAERIRDST